MAVPKQKISKSRRGMRRSNSKGKIPVLNIIENKMGDLTLSHNVSPQGDYNGESVTDNNEE